MSEEDDIPGQGELPLCQSKELQVLHCLQEATQLTRFQPVTSVQLRK